MLIGMTIMLGYGIGKTMLNEARTEMLEKMAYVDDMTGLANRRRCEEIWDNLEVYCTIDIQANLLV